MGPEIGTPSSEPGLGGGNPAFALGTPAGGAVIPTLLNVTPSGKVPGVAVGAGA